MWSTFAVYLDDPILACSDDGFMVRLKQFIQNDFMMKDLGELDIPLNIEITLLVERYLSVSVSIRLRCPGALQNLLECK